MKKKMQEKDESRQDLQSEDIENKSDTQHEENSEKNEGQELTGGQEQSPAKENGGAEALADKVVSEIRAIEEKLAEMQDKYIRLSAEFDNYRKRTLREKMELSKYAEENVLSKIVPFMDDFDRAMQHIETADGDAMRNGLNLIYAKFSEFLALNGVKEIDALNTDFNVDLHEAVAKVQVDDDTKKGKIVDVVMKGYYLRDKVIRHSKVVVGE